MIRFCARCGTRLPAPPPVECTACQATTWADAKPSASTVILHADRFLTIRRAQEPAAARWDLPGGFCDGAEHPADTATRETLEETGLRVRLGPLIGLYPGTYPYQGGTTPTPTTSRRSPTPARSPQQARKPPLCLVAAV